LYHLITDWSLYADASVLERMAVWNGGLGYFGALIGGIVGLILFTRHSGKGVMNHAPTKQFFLILDLLAFGAPLAQAIGRFGNYFNQELYGLPTTLPWGLLIKGERYHPLFAYEAIGTLSIFVFLNVLGWKKKFWIGKGQYAFVYIALYTMLRFWLEFLRLDTARTSGGLGILSIAQWICLSLAIGSICLFWLRRHADRGIEWELSTFV
jgi:phosphatidylglycerol---prolipoprotein diacylglyceryl transferase